MKKIKNLKQRLESDDYISALREMGIPSEIIKMFEDPITLTEAEIEDVKKWEDG
jgi:hypothetical protein